MTLEEVRAMTPDEKTIRLAELLGWTGLRPYPEMMVIEGFDPKDPLNEIMEHYSPIPDYCNDLNAVHSVERGLPSHLWTDYAMALRKVIQQECRKPEFYIPGTERAQFIADIWFYGATADHRTTALILTLAP